jgi:GntR family transcriptional regulator
VNLQLHPGSPIPLYQQLKNEIRSAVATSEVRPGATLPSVRALANTLGVSPTVVARAYSELIGEGLLTSRSRSKTQVAELASLNIRAFSEKDLAQELNLLLLQAQRFGLDHQAFLRVAGEVVDKAMRLTQPQVALIECLHEQAGILGKELSSYLGIAVRSIPLQSFEDNPQPMVAELSDDLAIVTTPPHFKTVRDLLPMDAPPLVAMSTTPDVTALLQIADTDPESALGVVTRSARYGDVVLSYVQKAVGSKKPIHFVVLDDGSNLQELIQDVDVAVVTPACKDKVLALSDGRLRIIEFTFHVDHSAVLMLKDMLPNPPVADRPGMGT